MRQTDDIAPMGDEPELPPFAVAGPLDEESFAVWGRVPTPRESAVAKSMPPPRVFAQAWDAVPSGLGLDCCEESRDLNRCGLRYSWLLGECFSCGATDWTAQPRGWHGPVRPPVKPPEPEPLPPPVELDWKRVRRWQAPGYFDGWVCGELSVSYGLRPGSVDCPEVVARADGDIVGTWAYDTSRDLAQCAAVARRHCSRFCRKGKTR